LTLAIAGIMLLRAISPKPFDAPPRRRSEQLVLLARHSDPNRSIHTKAWSCRA